MTEKKKETSGVSRREFLKDAGLLVGGAAVGTTVLLSACGGEDTTVTATKTTTQTITKTVTATSDNGPAAAENVISVTVNGEAHEVQVSPNETLQDMLRQKLGIMSPKDMCFGYGACGSCSVLLNGRPVLSCMTLAIECKNAEIVTAEGIADSGHPLLAAYIKHHCMQCGYCTPGFIVTAKALLDHNSNPTEADIREALNGNICRCGTYPAHIRAVLEAAGSL